MFGEPGTITYTEDGIRLQCHICGRFYQALGTHLLLIHGLSAVEYRKEFDLNIGQPLVGSRVLAAMVKRGKIRYIEHRERFRDPWITGTAPIKYEHHKRRLQVRKSIAKGQSKGPRFCLNCGKEIVPTRTNGSLSRTNGSLWWRKTCNLICANAVQYKRFRN